MASVPRVKLTSRKSALNRPPPTPVVYSSDRSKAMVTVLVLFFVALWFILCGDLFYVLPCVILFLCFSVLLALRLPRLGKRANLSAFRTFVRFALVWFCLFPLPLGVWERRRFVIVALPGLFSYLFFHYSIRFWTRTIFTDFRIWSRIKGKTDRLHNKKKGMSACFGTSRKHAYIILTPLNPTFI